MTQIPHAVRGYRQAFRDVQKAVMLAGQSGAEAPAATGAIFKASFEVSYELQLIRKAGPEALTTEIVQRNDNPALDVTTFAGGYLVGLKAATAVVQDWGRSMNSPVAANALQAMSERLDRLRHEMISEGGDRIRTLRGRRYQF